MIGQPYSTIGRRFARIRRLPENQVRQSRFPISPINTDATIIPPLGGFVKGISIRGPGRIRNADTFAVLGQAGLSEHRIVQPST
ncbi:MAG TPA: hypothetical protein DEB39_07755 [Planctomycetaceae bacterium]|nr:hypothetical protein [Planctomycetaceae bacterium]